MSSEVRCVRIKVKDGQLDRVREWAQTINARKSEALGTLKDEGMTIESAFLEATADGPYLIYYLRARSFEAASATAAASSHSIDAYHQEFKREAWGEIETLELLVDLEM